MTPQEAAFAKMAKKPVTWDDLGKLVDGLAERTQELIAQATSPLTARIEALERQLAQLQGGKE